LRGVPAPSRLAAGSFVADPEVSNAAICAAVVLAYSVLVGRVGCFSLSGPILCAVAG